MDKKALRRGFAAALVLGGALLMWLSTETMGGAIVMTAGILVEAFGIFWLDHAKP